MSVLPSVMFSREAGQAYIPHHVGRICESVVRSEHTLCGVVTPWSDSAWYSQIDNQDIRCAAVAH
jgi:hypothetical protein